MKYFSLIQRYVSERIAFDIYIIYLHMEWNLYRFILISKVEIDTLSADLALALGTHVKEEHQDSEGEEGSGEVHDDNAEDEDVATGPKAKPSGKPKRKLTRRDPLLQLNWLSCYVL